MLLNKGRDELFTYRNIFKESNLSINTKMRLTLLKLSPTIYKNLSEVIENARRRK